jgi:signal transduction histidine kinase
MKLNGNQSAVRLPRHLMPPSLMLTATLLLGGAGLPPAESTSIAITQMLVNGAPVDLHAGGKLGIGPQPRTVSFVFDASMNSGQQPVRVRFKLDGHEDQWRELEGEMRLNIRFLDQAGDQVGETKFPVFGQSPGWRGELTTAPFRPRREEIIVPPGATRYWVVMTSAGPPATEGVYAITNLVISTRAVGGTQSVVSLPWAFAGPLNGGVPREWIRDGLRPSMADVFRAGASQGFVIIDDDRNGHAEWALRKEDAKAVRPGDVMIVDWHEAYSLGLVKPETISYGDLPAGYYRFRVNELSIFGVPQELETSVAFVVPVVFWLTPWFWVSVVAFLLAVGAAIWRMSSSRKLRQALLTLEQQRAIDRERLRIAQDIHDDLGARVTQISLLSAVAEGRPTLPEEARIEFSKVSRMTRDLVSALYETVWAVNPENDNLDALTSYLCQISSQLCSQAQIRCRLEVPDIPSDFLANSQLRHHLIMAVKEAVNNVLKHARATEVRIRISLESSRLHVCVQDNGRGFDPAAAKPGNGLSNIESRMKKIGGTVSVKSKLAVGTELCLEIPVGRAK